MEAASGKGLRCSSIALLVVPFHFSLSQCSLSGGFPRPPTSVGGLDLDSRSSGCAHLGSEVGPPLGVVGEEVAVLVVLVRRYCHAAGAAVRRAVDDEISSAIKEETGPAAVRRVSPGLLDFIFGCRCC